MSHTKGAVLYLLIRSEINFKFCRQEPFAHQTVSAALGLITLANRDPHNDTVLPATLTSAAQAGKAFNFLV